MNVDVEFLSQLPVLRYRDGTWPQLRVISRHCPASIAQRQVAKKSLRFKARPTSMAEVSTLYYSEGGLSYSEGCTKGQRWRVVLWAILRKESLMADLIEAVKQDK